MAGNLQRVAPYFWRKSLAFAAWPTEITARRPLFCRCFPLFFLPKTARLDRRRCRDKSVDWSARLSALPSNIMKEPICQLNTIYFASRERHPSLLKQLCPNPAILHGLLKCFQKGDQRLLVGIIESGAEIVAAIDDVIGAFAQREELLAHIGEDLPRLIVGGTWRQCL